MWFSLPVNFLPCLPTSPRKLLEQVAARTVIHVDAPEIICLARSQEQRGAFTRTREKGLDSSVFAFLERRLPKSRFCGTPTDDPYETRIMKGASWLPVPNSALLLLPSNVSQARHSVTTRCLRELKRNRFYKKKLLNRSLLYTGFWAFCLLGLAYRWGLVSRTAKSEKQR